MRPCRVASAARGRSAVPGAQFPRAAHRRSVIHRLVLWNIDNTLVDVGRVTRDAYAEAFQKIVGRPLLQLSPTAGRTESEIIFETLAVNDVDPADHHLPEFTAALEAAGLVDVEIRETHRVHPHAAAAIVRARKP